MKKSNYRIGNPYIWDMAFRPRLIIIKHIEQHRCKVSWKVGNHCIGYIWPRESLERLHQLLLLLKYPKEHAFTPFY